MKIISINAGSSSLKFQLFNMDNETVIASGLFERIGIEGSFYTIKYNGEKITEEIELTNHTDAIKVLLDKLVALNIISSLDEIEGVGHRVVQGGDKYKESVIITDEVIEDIPSKEPVKAHLKIKSLGDFIEITGNVKANLTLECDLCLKEFEYKLDENIDEMFAKNTLQEEYGQETEIKDGQFVTDLEGENEIDIYDLLYQSVILNIPNKKVCGINCNKGVFQTDEEFVEEDPRMEVFKHIKLDK